MQYLRVVAYCLVFTVGSGFGSQAGIAHCPKINDGHTYADYKFQRKPIGRDSIIIGAGTAYWAEFRGPAHYVLYDAWKGSAN